MIIEILNQIEKGFMWALGSPKLWFAMGVLALFLLFSLP
jgi:hypothetical protein